MTSTNNDDNYVGSDTDSSLMTDTNNEDQEEEVQFIAIGDDETSSNDDVVEGSHGNDVHNVDETTIASGGMIVPDTDRITTVEEFMRQAESEATAIVPNICKGGKLIYVEGLFRTLPSLYHNQITLTILASHLRLGLIANKTGGIANLCKETIPEKLVVKYKLQPKGNSRYTGMCHLVKRIR